LCSDFVALEQKGRWCEEEPLGSSHELHPHTKPKLKSL